ncbi:50S ribosomal protein L18e [Methanosarcinales archaeon]|nr:MAG: 50S ribosomal protein L18e [Methanosarcinales archaeon]
MRRKRKTNPQINKLIEDLKRIARENSAPIWRDIAKRLEKPRRNYAAVNLSKINRYSSSNDTILVPGKVLSSGTMEKPVTVAALGFSKKAFEKICKCGEGGKEGKGEERGKCITIEELIKNNPKGSGVKIIV